jgi:CHAT domain-containing protein
MLGIPIEVLVDEESRYFGDRYGVSYAPSATIYAWLREQDAGRGASGPQNALLVGDPPFCEDHLSAMADEEEQDSHPQQAYAATGEPFIRGTTVRSALAGNEGALAALPRLPWTRQEVRLVASVIPATTTLLGAEASEQRLMGLAESGELSQFDTIHLATHALANDDLPERSALILSRTDLPDPYEAVVAGKRVHDGLLTAKEIIREWELDADLVTLSGCQTGLGRETAGEGYVGLAHAFLQVGARSLLVSLWKVEEEATALLMGRFYENLTGSYADERDGESETPMSKAAALREAKRWLREYTDEHGARIFSHPSYWSGFVLIGEP